MPGLLWLSFFTLSGAYVAQVDQEIPGASWIELPKGTYSVRPDSKKRSRCQLEVDVFFNYMKSHPCKGEWNKVAPLRILSFDIECAGRKGHFPEVGPTHRDRYTATLLYFVFFLSLTEVNMSGVLE